MAPARPNRQLLAVIAGALAVRAALTPLYAHLPNGYTDEGFWKFWMRRIDEDGVLNIFRTTETDYVGYHWVLWLLSLVYGAIGGPYTQTTPSLHILVKTPSLAFDAALIAVVWWAMRGLLDGEGVRPAYRDRIALLAAGVVALHPAIVYDSAVWAQTDSAIAAAMLAAAVLAAAGRPGAGWAVWALGFMVKPQPVVVLPVLIVLSVRQSPAALARGVIAALLVSLAVVSPWLAHGDAARIGQVYRSVLGADYGRLSSGAWNAWWFIDVARTPRPDDAIIAALPWLTFRAAGVAASAAAGGLATLLVWRAPRLREALLASSYLVFAFYMLPVSTHERYLFPLLALLLPVALRERHWLALYVALSATFSLNLFVSAPPVAEFRGRWVESPFSLGVAAVNVALFAWATVMVVREAARTRRPARAERAAVFGHSPGPAGALSEAAE